MSANGKKNPTLRSKAVVKIPKQSMRKRPEQRAYPLSPAMNSPGVKVSDHFRLGEMTDNGTTVQSEFGVTHNQLMFVLPINPRRIIGYAQYLSLLRQEVPPPYRMSPYARNSYQCEINKCTLHLESVIPTTVSAEVCAFYTPNLTRDITSDNVLDIFNSIPKSQTASTTRPSQTVSISMSSGQMFLANLEGDGAPDPVLTNAGYMVVFVKTQPVVALATTDDRAYLGPLVNVSITLDATFHGYELAPQSISDTETDEYSEYSTPCSPIPNHVFATNPSAGTPAVYFMPTFRISASLEAAAVRAADASVNTGQYAGSTGTFQKPVLALTRSAIRPYFEIPPQNYNGATVQFLTFKGIVDAVQSAWAGLISNPREIVAQSLNQIFGSAVGNVIYLVGDALATFFSALGTVPTPTPNPYANPPTQGLNYRWNATGWPVTMNGTPGGVYNVCGVLQYQSSAYNYGLSSIQTKYPELNGTIQSLQAQGAPPAIVYCPLYMLFSQFTGPDGLVYYPYFGRMSNDGAWLKVNSGAIEAKATFGQPTAVDTILPTSFVQMTPRTLSLVVNGRRPLQRLSSNTLVMIFQAGAAAPLLYSMGAHAAGVTTLNPVTTLAQFNAAMPNSDIPINGGYVIDCHITILDKTNAVSDIQPLEHASGRARQALVHINILPPNIGIDSVHLTNSTSASAGPEALWVSGGYVTGIVRPCSFYLSSQVMNTLPAPFTGT